MKKDHIITFGVVECCIVEKLDCNRLNGSNIPTMYYFFWFRYVNFELYTFLMDK